MATIFTDAVNFIGSTLKQAVTPDTMRDYRHANLLFVGSNFRLLPKSGFLFHVFFDVNPSLADQAISQRNPNVELGLMVKSVDLPKFSVAVKSYNAYNRPNLVQQKIGYDPVTVSFHDDNINLVRTFWQDYFNFYYRDTDYQLERLQQYHKYTNKDNFSAFGYGPRRVSTAFQEFGTIKGDLHYLQSIRIYSLHQKRFSEYILVKPLIRSFKHGVHQQSSADFLGHDMVVDYENVIYNSGTVGNEVRGFAELHYDKTVSPLRQFGRIKSLFGSGGLIDTAGSVLLDINQGNYASALFKAASGINMARGMNLKKAAISEITGIVTQSATVAIQEQVNQSLRGSSTSPVNIPTITGIDGALGQQYTGPTSATGVATLAGAAILLNSTPITNRYKRLPTEQRAAPTNYAPRLPQLPGAAARTTQTGDLTVINDQVTNRSGSTSVQVNDTEKRIQLDRKITNLKQQRDKTDRQLQDAKNQVANSQSALSMLQTKLSTAQGLPTNTSAEIAEKTRIITDTTQQIAQMNNLYQVSLAELQNQTSKLASIQQSIKSTELELQGVGV